MGIGSASWRLFLRMLIAMCINGIGSAELARKHLEGLQGPRGKDNTDVLIRLYDSHGHPIDDPAHQGTHGGPVHTHPTSHVDHMDPSSMIFFTLKDLQVGKTIPIYFRKRDPSSSPRFLPREKADSIPFSSKELPNLLEFFSLSPGSPQAKAMEHALRHCESKPIKRETKFCATSLESMLDFVRSVLGLKSPFQALTTSLLSKSTTDFQNYTILKTPVEVSAPKMVACHSLPYPYAIFYCHSQETENKVFKVRLVGENGDGVEAIAVCHMDTSEWNPDHVSFRVLGVQPGTSPVCHFFPADNLVWVPTPLSI